MQKHVSFGFIHLYILCSYYKKLIFKNHDISMVTKKTINNSWRNEMLLIYYFTGECPQYFGMISKHNANEDGLFLSGERGNEDNNPNPVDSVCIQIHSIFNNKKYKLYYDYFEFKSLVKRIYSWCTTFKDPSVKYRYIRSKKLRATIFVYNFSKMQIVKCSVVLCYLPFYAEIRCYEL